MIEPIALSKRSYFHRTLASSWEEIWEAGPYFDRLSTLLEDATDYAILVGWQIDSRLTIAIPGKSGQTETLKEKIIRLCEMKPHFQFYILMWDHAYFYVLEREHWQGRIWEDIHPRVHFIFDNRHPFGGSHHEKICLIDGKVALCGGVDLCDDRWDSPDHLYQDPRRSLDHKAEKYGPYHDLSVQVTGPVCADLQSHVATRWQALSNIPFPQPPITPPFAKESQNTVYVSRTQSNIDPYGTHPILVREIEFLFRDLIRSAQYRVILEGQYFWSKGICDLLCAKIQAMRSKPFELYLILSDLAKVKTLTCLMDPYQRRLLDRLQTAARNTSVRLIIGHPQVLSPDPVTQPPRPIYIHSKLIIIDDRFLSIGSANFASRALRIDTEIHLTLEAKTDAQRHHVQNVASQVLDHWHRPPIRLQPITPLRNLRRNRLPFDFFFDPSFPWPTRFKLRFRKLARHHHWIIPLSLVLLALTGSMLAVFLSFPGRGSPDWMVILFGIALSTFWLIPLPFVPTALLTTLWLGPDTGIRLTLFSIWIGSILGFSVARIFPTTVARYCSEKAPKWLENRFKERTFSALLWVLADPRIELRFKIAYQGLYCIPLPWFLMAMGVLAPSVLFLICDWGFQLYSYFLGLTP
ncbi:phospholipase D-like domain-containing protein [Bdellovibrionota bacterium FG-1]